MANNTLSDLNNHLFAQLERLGEEELTSEQIRSEALRAKAISAVAKNIIDNAKTALEGMKMTYESVDGNQQIPVQFKLKE